MITDITDLSIAQEIYSVSQLNNEVRNLLENNFPLIWVEGEISNFKRPSSGHMYFSLKDEQAQVRCAMFRGRNNYLPFQVKDGLHVLVKAKISLYEERGDYQLIIEHMEETGDGRLRREFEKLKQRLAQEGLFENQYKKPIPAFPKCIGVITSPTGAAIRDILNVLRRRFSYVPIIIYPTAVQGTQAAPQIVAALEIANHRKECDVLIVARGGGSLEDLWPFNEEIVARAIFASHIPIVNGVGHEIDFTIADFVADQRAPTPSAAAELVSPHGQEIWQKLVELKARLNRTITNELRHLQHELKNLKIRLQHPGKKLQDQAQRLDYLENNLIKTIQYSLRHQQAYLNQQIAKLQRYQPQLHLQNIATQQQNLWQRLQTTIAHQLIKSRQSLANASRTLDAVSPLNTLQRGYAIVTKDKKIVQDTKQIRVGDKIEARLKEGKLDCIVEKIKDL